MKRKITAIVLSIVMLFSLTVNTSVFAESNNGNGENAVEDYETDADTIVEKEIPKVETNSEENTVDVIEVKTWDELISNVNSAPTSTVIKITENLEADSELTIEGKNITIVPDVKDITITRVTPSLANSTPSVFKLKNNATLNFGSNEHNVKFLDSISRQKAGGVFECDSSTLNITNTSFEGIKYGYSINDTARGLINVNKGTVSLDNVDASHCTGSSGAYIYINNSTVNIQNSDISNNNVYGNSNQGGVIYTKGKDTILTMNNCTVQNNHSAESGGHANFTGPIHLTNGKATLTNVTVDSNSGGYGAGINARDTNLSLENINITNNTIMGDNDLPTYWQGAGMYLEDCQLSLKNVNITNNKGAFIGGGMYIHNTPVELDETVTISGNEAACGGGFYTDDDRQIVTISGATIQNNIAKADNKFSRYSLNNGTGAAIAIDNGAVEINSGNISGNTADSMGAAIMQNGKLSLKGSPTIEGDIYLPTSHVIDIIDTFDGKNILVDIQKNDKQEGKYDETYQEGRDVIVYADSLEAPDSNERSKFILAGSIKNDGFSLRNETISNAGSNPDNRILELSTAEEYQVVYSFVSGTRGKGLPDEITKLLPVDSNKYIEGSTVKAIQPQKTMIQVSDGVWTFKGYDKDSITASKDNLNKDGYIAFKGTWTFEKNKYSVTYSFKSGTKGKSLPEQVTDLLPVDSKKYNHGSTIKAIQPNKTAVEVDDGVWIFEGYDADEKLATSAVTFTGTWNFYAYQKVNANDLTVYEGGLGSNSNEGTGNALPEPVWKGQMKEHKVTVDGKEWNIDKQGLPFTWKYLDESGKEVTSSARVGTYSLYVYPLEDLKDTYVIIDDAYVLNLPTAGLEVSTVTVREVTNNANADSLSTETFKNVYNYAPTQEPANNDFIQNILQTLATLFDDSALDGVFDTITGTHTDECDPDEPHAHVEKGATFLKNGKEDMPVGINAKIGLLWDNFIPDVLGSQTRMEKLHSKSLEAIGTNTFDSNGTIHRDFKYIDLVDMTDGNIWVGTLSRDVTVYYPYPEEVDKNDDIAVTYYDGLTRDYTIGMTDENLDKEIDETSAHIVKNLRKTEKGILFDVPSKQFGPIEIMWQKSYVPVFEFVSGTDGIQLPDSVKALEPKTDKEYVEGINITAPELETTEVKTDDGVWVFQGWDEQNKVSKADVKFVGTWEFKMNAGNINEFPTINASDKTITVGDTFDPFKDVTAIDTEDGDLTYKVEVINNNVDTTNAGIYQITYRVTDSQGASSMKTVYVTVNPKMEMLNEIPVIKAEDKTVMV